MNRNTTQYMELPYNKNLIPLAKKLRQFGNLSEALLWNELKRKKFNNIDFDRQKIIGNYIVDFYCSELKLVIEIDGGTHNYKLEEDKLRDNYLSSLGLSILRVLDFDVRKDMSKVLTVLSNHIKSLRPPRPPSASTPPQRGTQEKNILKQYYNNALNQIRNDDYSKAFAYEKIVHSLQVIWAGNHIIKNEESLHSCCDDFLKCAKAAYSFHDIGRFDDIASIKNKKIDHGVLGAEIISKIPQYNDLRITIPIKHHGHLIKDFYEDKEYINICNEKLKKEIEEILLLVRDADKIANFYMLTKQYEKHKKAWEIKDDKEYLFGKISPACLEYLKNKECFPLSARKSYSDKLLNILSWIFDINYKTSFAFMKKHNIVDKLINITKQYSKETELLDNISKELNMYIDNKTKMESKKWKN